MHRKSYWGLIAILCICVGLMVSGCAKKGTVDDSGGGTLVEKEPTPSDQGVRTDTDTSAEDISPIRYEDLTKITWEDTAGELNKVYFDYDKSEIRQDQVDTLVANAQWMKNNTEYLIWIEGHCDERGTDEYNLALGERRALSIRNFLISEGVDGNRLYTISYGEERPVVLGHDEDSWSQNRRGEFKKGLPPQ